MDPGFRRDDFNATSKGEKTMGSLASRPKAPSTPQPQIVYVPSPASSPEPAPEKSSPKQGEPEKKKETDISEKQSKARAKSLLKRDRSRFGTVLTGFRGLLGSAPARPERKTLLGE
jgi:hypothetical protein